MPVDKTVLTFSVNDFFGIFFSLDDDFPDNVSQSRQLWEKVGQAWIFDEAQRDSRMKDRIDFQCEQSQPRHYPADG